MTGPAISNIAPLFIVADVPVALAFYRDEELASRGVRGFVIKDLDGYGLFFGRLRRDI